MDDLEKKRIAQIEEIHEAVILICNTMKKHKIPPEIGNNACFNVALLSMATNIERDVAIQIFTESYDKMVKHLESEE